jgi:hypothetical protein
MKWMPLAGRALCAALLGAGFSVFAEPTDFTQLAQSRYVHCAFYKTYETDPVTGGPIMVEGKADSLVHFQDVDLERATARAIYTRMSGSHEVRVIKTARAVHFIDDVAGMYIMTSVHSCLEYDEKRGACVMYGAVHARLFDTLVLRDPDRVYETIKNNADPGFCDYSFIGIREAASRLR